MDEISESITQIRVVHVAQRVLAEGKLTAVRSFLTEIPASFFPSAQKTKKKAFQSEKGNQHKVFLRRYNYVLPLLMGIFQQHNLPSENVDGIFIQHVMGVDDVAKTFRHLLAFLIIDKPMGKDRLRKRQPS